MQLKFKLEDSELGDYTDRANAFLRCRLWGRHDAKEHGCVRKSSVVVVLDCILLFASPQSVSGRQVEVKERNAETQR